MQGCCYILEYLECKFMDGALTGAAGWAVYDIISDVIYDEDGSFDVSGRIDASKLKEEIEFARKEGFLQEDESFNIEYRLTYDDSSTDFVIHIETRPDADVSEQTASLDWSQFDVHLVINVNEFMQKRREFEDEDLDDDEY